MTAILTRLADGSAPAPARAARGSPSGGVRAALRLEGAAAFAAAIALYAHAGFSWLALIILFLAPDLSMLAYLVGPRAGALAYILRPYLCVSAAARPYGLCVRLARHLGACADRGRPHRL